MKMFLVVLFSGLLCFALYGCASSQTDDTAEVPEDNILADMVDSTENIVDSTDAIYEETDAYEDAAEVGTESLIETLKDEQYAEFAQIAVGEWIAFTEYAAASNALILREDGTGSYGTDVFTWSVYYADAPYVDVMCLGDDSNPLYYLSFIKFEEEPVWRCNVSRVDFFDENGWSATHEDMESFGQRYNKDALEIIEITVENFAEYFDIRPEVDWSVNPSGKAMRFNRTYFLFLKEEYAERMAYADSCIDLKYTCRMDYYACDVNLENMQYTVTAPIAEEKSLYIDASPSFSLHNNLADTFPGAYCIAYLQGDSGKRIQSTDDIYYTAIMENFSLEECSCQLVLAK